MGGRFGSCCPCLRGRNTRSEPEKLLPMPQQIRSPVTSLKPRLNTAKVLAARCIHSACRKRCSISKAWSRNPRRQQSADFHNGKQPVIPKCFAVRDLHLFVGRSTIL